MTNMLINRYEDTERFPGSVQCVEMELDKGGKHKVAEMQFVVLPHGSASVFGSGGTISGMAELTKDFIKSNGITLLVDQVHRDTEVKAMYRVGLRFGANPDLNLTQTLEVLKERKSIFMIWKSPDHQ